MPIEILKQGEVPEDRPYVAICDRCKSELRFKESDGNVVYGQRDGDYVSITCPVCGQTITKELKSRW